MVAPLPQERQFKQEFDRNRLAALRGDSLSLPSANNTNFLDDDSGQEAANTADFFEDSAPDDAANNSRFFAPDSEDGILSQFPTRSSVKTPELQEEDIPDPVGFARIQQQARMAQGINAPELISPEAAELPDPEYSTEEETVTYGESLNTLAGQAAQAETLEEARGVQAAMQNKAQQAVDAANDRLQEWLKEKGSRWLAKGIGNGSNAVDSLGWDGWIVFVISYLYLMARGFVTVFVPEPTNAQDDGMGGYALKKGLHTLLPIYRPLREPGDFGYFLAAFIVTVIIIGVLIAALIILVNIVALPAFMPGAATSLNTSP